MIRLADLEQRVLGVSALGFTALAEVEIGAGLALPPRALEVRRLAAVARVPRVGSGRTARAVAGRAPNVAVGGVRYLS